MIHALDINLRANPGCGPCRNRKHGLCVVPENAGTREFFRRCGCLVCAYWILLPEEAARYGLKIRISNLYGTIQTPPTKPNAND